MRCALVLLLAALLCANTSGEKQLVGGPAEKRVFAEKPCAMCLAVMGAVKDKYPDAAQITPAGLLTTAQAKCDEVATTPKQKELCRTYIISYLGEILEFIKKAGEVNPKKICDHENLC